MTAPLILVAHGSPDPRSAAASRALADRVAAVLGREARIAFIDHDEPDIAGAAAALGRPAVVVPLLLTSAFHARVDVPRAVDEAMATTGIDLVLAPAVGTPPALVDAAARGLDGPVVFATAGTSDAAARDALRAAVAAWSARHGRPAITAFATQAEPDPATAIAVLEAETGRRAGVASLVLFPGVLPDRIAAAAGDRAVSAPVGEAPEAVDAVAASVAAVLEQVPA